MHTTMAINNMELRRFPKWGTLVDLEKDWHKINIPNLVQHQIRMAYPWTVTLALSRRFTSLSPHVLRAYDKCRLDEGYELHLNDLPELKDHLSVAMKYDQFLQDVSSDGRPNPDVEFDEG